MKANKTPKRTKKEKPHQEVDLNSPGIKLVQTLRGDDGFIERIAWSPNGTMLASPSEDKTIRLWDVNSGETLRTFTGHTKPVNCVAFDPLGRVLASVGRDSCIRVWDIASGKLKRTIKIDAPSCSNIVFGATGHTLFVSGLPKNVINSYDVVSGKQLTSFNFGQSGLFTQEKRIDDREIDMFGGDCIAIDQNGRLLAAYAGNLVIGIWDTISGNVISRIAIKRPFYGIAFDPTGKILVTGDGSLLQIWDSLTGKLLRTLEGHTSTVDWAEFSPDGRLLASKSNDDTFRLWRCDTWETVAVVSEINDNERPVRGLAFHPRLPLIASVFSSPNSTIHRVNEAIHIWELDLPTLFDQISPPTVTYTSAKIVLVGDSGVGKTGLGWRLAHGEFKEHSSTHGQQFWLLNQLCMQRSDGAQCEAVLWDLAGQEDYKLIHALFLDDADLALVLFDPGRHDDPLGGVEFWLKQLRTGTSDTVGTPTVLIAARSDRGSPRITREELVEYCNDRGISAYFLTSAKAGYGIDELISCMQGMIPWDDKAATVTTETFKKIKDYVLEMKENHRRRQVLLTAEDLRQRLAKMDRKWKFTDEEMLTAVGHLANHGYVTCLKTSNGDPRFLLVPELLNNLAASFVLEARRNQRGLGALEEGRLLSGGYKFPELEKLSTAEKEILVDSAAVLFLEHNLCFRETDPLNGLAYLVFPELINLKRPFEDNEGRSEDSVAYTVGGAVENVYASLVVLMGYTQTFTRTNQWQNHASYEVGNGQLCGFRLEKERAGELDFVLFFGESTDAPVKMLFQSLFENFLSRRNLTVQRFEPVVCSKGHRLNQAVVREQAAMGDIDAFCSRCGEKVILPRADQPISLTRRQAEEMASHRRVADTRSRFEQVLFRIKTYVTEQKIDLPVCFISYAWGITEHEHWVEKSLAKDLFKAGVFVLLDRWENARIGASIPRFVERIGECDRVIVVGTNLYRSKYENKEPMRGYVAAAEGDLIGKRMIGTEEQKESVLPVLLHGTEETAFPTLLHGRVYADFRRKEAYFEVALELLLSLYGISSKDTVASELRDLLRGEKD